MILLETSEELAQKIRPLVAHYLPQEDVTPTKTVASSPSLVIREIPDLSSDSQVDESHVASVVIARSENELLNFRLGEDGTPQFQVSEDKLSDPFFWGAVSFALKSQESFKSLEGSKSKLHRLENFAAIIAHDVRGPLANICMRLDVALSIAGEAIPEKAQTILRAAFKTGESLSVLIQTLYDYAKLGRVERKLELVRLEEVIAEVVDALGRESQERLQLEVRNLPHVLGDRALLVQVFQNLLINAVQYRVGDSVAVTVSVRESREEKHSKNVLISVKDNGRGIARPGRVKVLTSSGKQESSGGLGLGLLIIQQALELQGGQLAVNHNAEIGSEFLVTLQLP